MNNTNQKVTQRLTELGIPTSLNGFELIRHILVSALFAKELVGINTYYEVLAEAKGKSKSAIVLAIRYAKNYTPYKTLTSKEFLSRVYLELKGSL